MTVATLLPVAAIDARREAVRRVAGALNGIDFVEVDPADHSRIRVSFLKPLAADLQPAMASVEGGTRRRGVRIVSIDPVATTGATQVALVADGIGDRSPYRIVLDAPAAAAIDPLLAWGGFVFFPECGSDVDCEAPALPEPGAAPPMGDYGARDYAALRRLLLDRLSRQVPGWRERNPSDVGVMLAELFAYAGDRLAWRQDAITTEAALSTARLRTSVRRHARLMDYRLQEGAAARLWVRFRLKPGGVPMAPVPAGTLLLTGIAGEPAVLPPNWEKLKSALAAGAQPFELVTPAAGIDETLDTLPFHRWGADVVELPAGATSATLRGHFPALATGMVLVLAESVGAETGDPADADPARRHAVRLVAVDPPALDPLDGTPITAIRWHGEDALPFTFTVASLSEDGAPITDVSAAWGNIALAEHGRHVGPPVEAGTPLPLDAVPADGRYRPPLPVGPIAWAMPDAPTPDMSATASATIDPALVQPAIALTVTPPDSPAETWRPASDLLGSDGLATAFVVEAEDDGTVHLLFGDGHHGRKPVPGSAVVVSTLKIGGGRIGNVPPGAIGHLLHADPAFAGVENPLPATGGLDPEPIDTARHLIPQSWRHQLRAVTPDDYAAAASAVPGVQRTTARLRWNGSWYAVTVVVDPVGGVLDDALAARILAALEPIRMMGHDLRVLPARPVPLDIVFTLCLLPGHLAGDVERALMDRFTSGLAADGSPGLFHPDRLGISERFQLSPLIAAAQVLDGVSHVEVTRFGRMDQPGGDGVALGYLVPGTAELFELANDPSYPDRGRFAADIRATVTA